MKNKIHKKFLFENIVTIRYEVKKEGQNLFFHDKTQSNI